MKKILLLIALFFTTKTHAQQLSLNGDVADEKGNPLGFVSVALLHPEDSTLAFFGMSDDAGHFQIKNILAGKYLLQAALLGYQTTYKNLSLPLASGNNLGTFILQLTPVTLNEVNISAERIPMLLKKDTVEYDASAYKTKPDAVAEDLLKKLPGVQVDRAGNIKAQGENVNQVLVDGKEFFGTDPKVATRNLPANAVKKVQVFDKKSDESELTGIDDGSRNKTINLLLKDDKKSASFGDVTAGVGTDNRYQASGKFYRFTKKSQFAALGMLNNINHFGFTFKDYLDFNGGIQSIMNGSGDAQVQIGNDDNSFPVDFGQPVTGLITSGAGGLNYTYEPKKDHRFNISYLGNGADKNLDQTTLTKNFTDESSFISNDSSREHTSSFNHRFNFGWRTKPDSTSNIIVNGNAQVSDGKQSGNSFTQSFSADSLLNTLSSVTNNNSNRISGDVKATYLKKWSGNWKLFKLYSDISASHAFTKREWDNITHLFGTNEEFADLQYQHDQNDLLNASFTTSVTRKLGRGFYLVPEINAGAMTESLNRKQGIPPAEENVIDTLSADFSRHYNWLRPGINFKKSNDKTQMNFAVYGEAGIMSNSLQDAGYIHHDVFYILPKVSWQYEYKTGKRIMLFCNSQVNVPNANQLLPTINNINPLQLYYGNRNLLAEYEHDLRFNWNYFDQFSFTSLFAGLSTSYTHDKINWSRIINDDLTQVLTLVNVPDDYRANLNLEFSTPIRKLGITMDIRADESWNRGINIVNGVQNINTNLTHDFTLTFDNRKKDKWDISVGGSAELSNAKYSVDQSLDNHYFNFSYFTDISFTPNERWYFSASADVTNYNSQSFGQSISVPLLSAEISRYLLKNNRGVITFNAFDLLNKNTGVERYSELNYLQENKSNIIGRYFMISFKYRLNKFDDSKSGINVKVNKH